MAYKIGDTVRLKDSNWFGSKLWAVFRDKLTGKITEVHPGGYPATFSPASLVVDFGGDFRDIDVSVVDVTPA